MLIKYRNVERGRSVFFFLSFFNVIELLKKKLSKSLILLVFHSDGLSIVRRVQEKEVEEGGNRWIARRDNGIYFFFLFFFS